MILVTKKVCRRPEIKLKCGSDVRDLPRVLTDLGCLCCYDPAAFDAALEVMHRKGLHYAALLCHGAVTDATYGL